MKIECACGKTFEARRSNAKYCSDRCRKRGQRRPKLSVVPPGGLDVEADSAAEADEARERVLLEGPMASSTWKELDKAGRLDTAMGQAVLSIAIKIDLTGLAETGSGYAALIKQHATSLALALEGANESGDVVDQILESAALKLVMGGG